MRISDWSSDVCSSDLVGVVQVEVERTAVVADQFRHLVGHVVDAERELRVPRQFHAGLQVMREVAVRGARTFAVGADVAGDVAHAPVAAAPLVVQRCAGFREALQPDLLGATVDRVPELVAELQHVAQRSEEHTSELQSLMSISYAVFCLKKKK